MGAAGVGSGGLRAQGWEAVLGEAPATPTCYVRLVVRHVPATRAGSRWERSA